MNTPTDTPPEAAALDLDPCPFCGATGEELGLRVDPNPPVEGAPQEWGIQCYQCHICTPYYDSEAEVRAAWNRRDLPLPQENTCSKCAGFGYARGGLCWACEGKGTVVRAARQHAEPEGSRVDEADREAYEEGYAEGAGNSKEWGVDLGRNIIAWLKARGHLDPPDTAPDWTVQDIIDSLNEHETALSQGSRAVDMLVDQDWLRRNVEADPDASMTIVLGAERAGRLAAEARVAWRPIENAPRGPWPGPAQQVLLIAQYPHGRGWSDIYQGWWDKFLEDCSGGWTRWPHTFGPTHWMPLPPPPTEASGSAPDA